MTGPGALEGKILACDKCANVATQSLINQILSSLTLPKKVAQLLICNSCLYGHYKIMTKKFAASVAIQYAVKSVLDKGEYKP